MLIYLGPGGISLIQAIGRQWQLDLCKFKSSLVYKIRPYPKKRRTRNKKKKRRRRKKEEEEEEEKFNCIKMVVCYLQFKSISLFFVLFEDRVSPGRPAWIEANSVFLNISKAIL